MQQSHANTLWENCFAHFCQKSHAVNCQMYTQRHRFSAHGVNDVFHVLLQTIGGEIVPEFPLNWIFTDFLKRVARCWYNSFPNPNCSAITLELFQTPVVVDEWHLWMTFLRMTSTKFCIHIDAIYGMCALYIVSDGLFIFWKKISLNHDKHVKLTNHCRLAIVIYFDVKMLFRLLKFCSIWRHDATHTQHTTHLAFVYKWARVADFIFDFMCATYVNVSTLRSKFP